MGNRSPRPAYRVRSQTNGHRRSSKACPSNEFGYDYRYHLRFAISADLAGNPIVDVFCVANSKPGVA